jgi:Family of unknown function (DUF6677)
VPETAPDPSSPQPAPVVSPMLPCVLAWVLPGLGHLSLGRKGRALAFFAVVLATFALGLFSGGTSSLADPQQPLSYLATFDNLALGPVELIARKLSLGSLSYRLPIDESDERRKQLLARLRERVRHPTYEYGSTYLLTAGLMNMLLILDAFDIATGRKS